MSMLDMVEMSGLRPDLHFAWCAESVSDAIVTCRSTKNPLEASSPYFALTLPTANGPTSAAPGSTALAVSRNLSNVPAFCAVSAHPRQGQHRLPDPLLWFGLVTSCGSQLMLYRMMLGTCARRSGDASHLTSGPGRFPRRLLGPRLLRSNVPTQERCRLARLRHRCEPQLRYSTARP
jgi:hypothetical protein